MSRFKLLCMSATLLSLLGLQSALALEQPTVAADAPRIIEPKPAKIPIRVPNKGGDIGKGNWWRQRVLDGDRYKAAVAPGARLPSGQMSKVIDFEDLTRYCDSAYEILTHYADLAEKPFGTGDYEGARRTLFEGLIAAEEAFRRDPQNFSPLTRIAISRGLFFNDAFQGACNPESESYEKCIEREDRVASGFLSKYYDYILSVVVNLDRNYYLPSHYGRHRVPGCEPRSCNTSDCDDGYGYPRHACFEPEWGRRFYEETAKSAKALLDLFLGKNTQSDGIPLPSGFAKDFYELKIASMVLIAAAQDLNDDDVFRRYFGCAIKDLERVAHNVDSCFADNANNLCKTQSPYFDSADAVVKVRRFMHYAAKKIGEYEAYESRFEGNRCEPPVWTPYGRR